jgi:hypothetical protein
MRNVCFTGAMAAALLLGACAGPSGAPKNRVIVHYQHVANAHQVRFTTPLALSHRAAPVNYVAPIDSQGFWAIFVLCSVDVSDRALASFRYNVNNFEVEFGKQHFGVLQPYTLRYEDSADLNKPLETPAIVNAIAAEIQEGPVSQVFAHGFHASLNYRIAVYVPKALDEYAGTQLQLRYTGQSAILVGNDHPPSDLPYVGGNGGGIAASCLPISTTH